MEQADLQRPTSRSPSPGRGGCGGVANDLLLSRDARSTVHNNPDTLSGGVGFDRAQVDVVPSADNLAGIEELFA